MLNFIRSFPTLVIPVAIYNLLIGATSADASGAENVLARSLGSIPMPATETNWTIHTADLIMLVGLVALFFEVIGSGRSSNGVLVKHVLNMLLFVVCLIEFLLLRPFATSSFFLLLVLSLMATVSGFVISTVTARKDIEFAH